MTPRRMTQTEATRSVAGLGQVIDETRRLFHRLRYVAEQVHGSDELTAGERGVLVELAEQGPRTVPDMARARPVSRQHIQMLVNILLERCLVELVTNPRHRRSKLVQLTRKGQALVNRIQARERHILAKLGKGLNPTTLEAASQTLKNVRELLETQIP